VTDNIQIQKQYRTAGWVMLWISIAVVLVRIVTGFINFPAGTHTRGVFFSVTVQVFCLFLIPLVMYSVMLRKSPKRVFSLSFFKKTSPFVPLLSVLLGIVGLFVISGVYNAWMVLLGFLGYSVNQTGGGTPIPATWYNFAISIVITAILPGFCEEFATRGVVLDAFNRTYRKVITIMLLGLAFGLMHQNIRQFMFTSLMGMFLVYLTVELKSIWPAIIIHTFNNAASMYINYANKGLALPLGNFVRNAESNIFSNPPLLAASYLGAVAVFFALTFVIIKLGKRRLKLRNNNATTHNETSAERFKPSLRDNLAFIGALIITTAATIYTFASGLR